MDTYDNQMFVARVNIYTTV